MIITAEEAVRLQRGVETAEEQAVGILLDRMDKAVRAACVHKCNRTTVAVPDFLWGVPSFDRGAVANEVTAFFRGRGFSVTSAPMGRLLLAWGPPDEGRQGEDAQRQPSFMAAPPAPRGPAESMIDDECFAATGPAIAGVDEGGAPTPAAVEVLPPPSPESRQAGHTGSTDADAMALSDKTFQGLVVVALLLTLVGILYDTFKSSQGEVRHKRISQGLRKDEIDTSRFVGAARSPGYMNLGVAPLAEYAGKYIPDAAPKPDVTDTRVGAPVYWGPYEDDMQSLADAYGAAFNPAATGPQPPTIEELKQGNATTLIPSVEQRGTGNDLLRGNP
ncbi:hypothetical protein JKP88DRAFT_273030 [Tribonema minus]|uniref:Uncharacterized protein n=1 Tax=Tribonema minus TaxID=303371 RepID=A0A835YYC8_9STRA|nr:hypothetical protein JKP88DRAFT_273030 [Tribonema minus]